MMIPNCLFLDVLILKWAPMWTIRTSKDEGVPTTSVFLEIVQNPFLPLAIHNS